MIFTNCVRIYNEMTCVADGKKNVEQFFINNFNVKYLLN